MQYLLSVPENFASCRGKILPDTEDRRYIAAADPKGAKIGSGGATAWLLQKEQKQPSQIESYQFQYAFFHYRFAINRFVDSSLKVAAKVVDFAG